MKHVRYFETKQHNINKLDAYLATLPEVRTRWRMEGYFVEGETVTTTVCVDYFDFTNEYK